MPLLLILFCSVGSVVCMEHHHFSDTIPIHTDSVLLLLLDQQQSVENEAILMNEQDRALTGMVMAACFPLCVLLPNNTRDNLC